MIGIFLSEFLPLGIGIREVEIKKLCFKKDYSAHISSVFFGVRWHSLFLFSREENGVVGTVHIRGFQLDVGHHHVIVVFLHQTEATSS